MTITTARLVGALFLIATVTYMLGDSLIASVLDGPNDLLQVSRNNTRIVAGVLFEFVDAAAVAAIGIVLYPILRRHNEAIALGYAGTRIVECLLLIFAGVCSLSLIPLSQEYLQAGSQSNSHYQALGELLVAQSDLAFQVAMVALGLGSLPFCYLLFKSRLIPRALSVLGIVGYAVLVAGSVLEIFGIDPRMIHFAPGGLFELILPIWLIVKGFDSSAVSSYFDPSDAPSSSKARTSIA